jgi:hypothetical protein
VDSPILLKWINLFPKLGMSCIFISIFTIFLTEIPHHEASHLGLRCLLKGISLRNILNIEITIQDIPNFGNKLIQFRRIGESTRHKWVNDYDLLKYLLSL